jgi:signal-transduction protein with cAMP-binding, CBS, and nucleotidyltransferase domain
MNRVCIVTPVSIVKRLKVRDVIAGEAATIDPSVSLLDAAKRMVEARKDAFIVSPLEKDEPFGIITQRDVVDLFADEVDIGKVTVGEVANKPLFIVSPGMPILYAAKMFRKAGVHHLAVFNGQEILGIISYSDVLNGLPNLIEQIYSEFD